MSKKNVVVLFGGQSSEHEISKLSCKTIFYNICKDKYNIIPIFITKDGNWKMYEGPLENIGNSSWEKFAIDTIISPDAKHGGIIRIVGEKVNFIPVDVVFPVLHGKWGEDGTIQGLLELAKIPYVGCKVLTSAIAMDKAYTKIVVNSINIDQAKYKVVHKYDIKNKTNLDDFFEVIEKDLGYPCFIKPANAGSSVGITFAKNKDEIKKGIDIAFLHDEKIILEQAIFAREIECAVLGDKDEVKASVLGEVKSGTDFYDFDGKYNNEESKTIIPANLDKDIETKIKEYAIKIFKALDGSGLSRVDFFVEKNTNRIFFNEINTMPGFTQISMYPMLFEASGLKTKELIDELIKIAIKNG